MLKIINFFFWMLLIPLGRSQSAVATPASPVAPVAPHSSVASKVNVLPYATGQWRSLLQAQTQNTSPSNGNHGRANSPIVVHFWGVTCGPCLTEMPQWGRFVTDNLGYKVVFIQVDDVSTGIMSQLLAKAHLAQAINYKLTTPFDEFMRYEVDPKWGGETPYTILVNASGQQTQLNGLVNFGKLRQWYQQNS